MYIGTDPLYYSGTLTGIRKRARDKFVSQTFVNENNEVRKRSFMSKVYIDYLKRTR